jgi:hypothetical protein
MTGHECSWVWADDTVAGACYHCSCSRSLYVPAAPDYHSLGGEVARLRTAARRLARAVRRIWRAR